MIYTVTIGTILFTILLLISWYSIEKSKEYEWGFLLILPSVLDVLLWIPLTIGLWIDRFSN